MTVAGAGAGVMTVSVDGGAAVTFGSASGTIVAGRVASGTGVGLVWSWRWNPSHINRPTATATAAPAMTMMLARSAVRPHE